MITPRIHLNGSDGETLLRENIAALDALQAAREALYRAAPNARDYYVIDRDAYTQAFTAHTGRLRRLEHCINEIQEVAQAIQAQLR